MKTENFSRAAAMLLMMLLTASTAGAQETISGLTYNTEGGYYEIPDAAALNALAAYVNAGNDASWKTFKQTANITFSHSSEWNDASSKESNFNGIGNDTENHPFKGSYYGQGFTISGVRMYLNKRGVGLFGYVRSATIDGIVLTDSRITGSYNTAGIVGKTYNEEGNCIVSNCHVRSNVLIHHTQNDDISQGGIVGVNNSGCQVINCTSAVTITGGSKCQFFGGIVGDNSGIMRNNIAIGVTIGDIEKYYGAIVGTSGGVLSNNYYYDCTVRGLTSNIGCNGADIAGAFNASPDHFTASGSEYTIKTATGWNVFCECLNHNDRYSRFSGTTVKLEANIEVSRMAGSDSHDFCGTFDGQEHTLTFNYGTSDAYSSEEYIAPFHYVSNVDNVAATIKDLHVAGNIYTSGKYTAGLVAQHWGTLSIENCRVSTVIYSSVSGEGTHGGFEAMNIGTLNIKGCVFDGKLLTTNGTTNCGGFVAWHYGGTTNISNSLYAPAALEEGETEVGTDTSYPSATFLRNVNNPNITNCYYTRALGTAQGKQIYSITAGENMTSLDISGSTATAYSVSDISFYANNSGLKYGNTCYACNGDNVALTLSHTTVPAGYSFSNYAVSAGSLSGTTLTMPNQDVTVSAPYTLNTYTITYNLAGGSVAGANPTTFSVESETFTLINPTRTNYIFSGWTGSNGSTPQTTVTIAKGSTENRTYTANWTPDAAHFSVSGNEYTIHTAEGWGVFCDALQDNANYNRFSGKTVKLDGNIGTAQEPITRWAGSSGHEFQGIFDGGGHTLTVNYSSNTYNDTAAPFSYVSGATIQNLIVTGNCGGTYGRAAGIVGESASMTTITNCISSVTLSGGPFNGGISIGGHVDIEGCIYNGLINTTDRSGGFVGYAENDTRIANSLFDPQEGSTIVGGTFYHISNTATITNSYYTRALGTPLQGKAPRTVTGGAGVTVSAVSPIGSPTSSDDYHGVYTVSGITAYANGITRTVGQATTFYYGSGDKVSLSLSHADRAGYTFSCYAASNDGTLTGTENPYTLTMPDADVTINATWTPITYSITYHPNDGEFTTDKNSFTIESETITLDVPTRTGYTFGGWYDNEGLTGNAVTTIDHGSTVDVELWAKWTPINYTVVFKGNGNTGGSMSNQNFTYDAAQNLTANAFTRVFSVTFNYNDNHNHNDKVEATATFNGWATNAGGTVVYTNQQSVINLADTEGSTVYLYANWTDGSVTLPTPTRTGYTFGGWYDNSALTGNAVTTIAHGSTGDVELWAKWTSNTYTVHFDGNGATGGSMDNQTFTYDAAQNLTANAFTRAFIVTYSYNEATGGNNDATATATATFNGWATTADGTVAYTNQQSVRNLAATGTVNLYANWTDGNVTLPTPTKTGYTFGGWYSDAGLTASVGAAGASYTPSANITLYAKWTPITYTITYDLDGGTVATANPTTYNIETETFTLTNPTKPGYFFAGWTGSNGSTPQPTVTIEQGSIENRTYTANYEDFFSLGGLTFRNTSGTEVKVTACNSDLTAVTIPATVTYKEATYPVTAIDVDAFNGCTALKFIILNATTPPALGSGAFNSCNALTDIYVPAGSTETYKTATNWQSYANKIQGCDGICGETVLWTYNSDSKTLTIFGIGAMANYYDLNIPWYNYRDNIMTVVIRDGVTSIGNYAFSYCTGLTTVFMEATTPPTLGDYTFNGCRTLFGICVPANKEGDYKNANGWSAYADKIFVIDGTCGDGVYWSYNSTGKVLSIFGGGAMADLSSGQPWASYRNDISKVAIGEGVTTIGKMAFNNCTSLTTFTIPASVTSIGGSAFSGCSSLATVFMLATTPPTLNSGVFDNCSALTAIYVPTGTAETYKTATNWSAYADKIVAFDGRCGDNVYYSYDSDSKTLTIFGKGAMANYDFGNNQPWDNYRGNIMTVVIRNGVTSIGDCAFYYHNGLTTVIMQATTPPTLGDYTFDGCPLDGIYVPANKVDDYKDADGWSAYADKISAIGGTCGDGVYWSYNSTDKVLTIFGGGAMADLSSGQPWASYRNDITMVAIGDGVTTIGKMAFNNCTSLTTITIPARVATIGGSAFSGCSSLATVFMLATTPPTLNSGVFDNCSALTAIYVPTGTAETYKAATNWSAYADKIVAFDGRCGDNVYYSYDSDSKTLTIFGKGAMANYNFWGDLPWYSYCDEFTTLNILDGVTTIGEYAFVFCSSLTTVNIPASVMTIGEGAFVFCSSLTTVNIPASVTTIGYGAFQYCTGLTSITIPVSVTSIADQVFANCTGLTSINIPAGVTSIDRGAFAGCKGLNAFTVDNGNTAFVSEDGVLFNKAKTTLIQYPAGNSRAAYTIPSSVTSIGGGAFNSCSGLTSITIPASVTSIGSSAFQSCTGLTSIEIPASVTTIGDWVFSSCTGLTSIEIPANVTSIGDGAFLSCTSLTSITIPASVTIIGDHAFNGCTGLTEVIVLRGESSITQLGDVAFNGCNALTTIYVPTDKVDDYKDADNWKDYAEKIKGLNEISAIALADKADNRGLIAAVNGNTNLSVTLQGRTLYKDGDWNTLCLPFNATKTGPLAGATIKEIDTETAYNGHKTGLEDGTLYLNFRDAESIVAGRPYIVKWDDDLVINSEDDWNTFASNVNNGTESYQGKLVKLAADISVSTMVGTSSHPFRGIFDGAGHTLNVSITDETNQGTAPFRYISDATIRNLKVTGTVTGNLHCAGLVGFAKGTNAIRQCEVAASVICSGGSHSHCGGILGHGLSSATTITDCLFSGTISGATTATGIIYGWGDGGGTHTIVNCLANGTYTDCNGIELLRKDNGTEVITNCYKTQNIGSQGTYTTATGSDLVALLGDGWQVSGENVVPKLIPAIVNPVFVGVTINASAPTAVTSKDGTVSFTGSYSPVSIAGEDRSILFLGASNTLYYPNAAMTINACRAYFQLTEDAQTLSRFVLNFGDEEVQGIKEIDDLPIYDLRFEAGAWYTIDGVKLDGKPTKKGLYIHGDRKVVIP